MSSKKKDGKTKDEPEPEEEEEDFFNMEELFERRPKIVETIFKFLDNKSLTICREVSTAWKEFIDKRNYPWTRICKKNYPSDQDRIKLEENKILQLYLAANYGQTEMFCYLLQEVEKEEKNLGFSRNSEGMTPFLMAAKKGHFQICNLIIEEVKAIKKVKDLNIDLVGTRDNDGYHALHWSCSEGQVKVVELILENSDSRKIYLNEKDDHGRTALHLACKRGQLSVVELLFEKSQELMIDLNATDNMNLTSFHWACQEGHTEVAQLFLEKADEFKLDLNVADYELEWTPFHFACHEGRKSIVDMILEKSEDVKIFVNLYDKLARTGFDLVEDDDTYDLITEWQQHKREAKMCRTASLKSRLLQGSKMFKASINK